MINQLALEKIKSRDSSLDLVRIFALFSVISIHFFLKSGFYDTVIDGTAMYFITIFRTFFMICVPLFLILSGYLLNKKQICVKYYFALLKTYNMYILASIACAVFKNCFASVNTNYNFIAFMSELFNYQAANYSWYIKMYIGLYLVIPFVNIGYHHIKTQNQKRFLIFTMLVLTAFPTWWAATYPITYFLIGAYFAEYKCNFKISTLLVLLIISIILTGSISFLQYRGTKITWDDCQSWGFIYYAINSMLVFRVITKINTFGWNTKIKYLLKMLSELCLGAYLVSYIFDSIFYPILVNSIPEFATRVLYYVPITLVVFLCSIALSILLQIVNKTVFKLFALINSKLKQLKIKKQVNNTNE